MAASMLSLWVCAVYLNGYRLKFGKHLIFALSILLTGSLLGIMGVAVNLLFIAFHQMKINLISLLRASVKREFLSFHNYFCRSGSDNNLLVTQSTN